MSDVTAIQNLVQKRIELKKEISKDNCRSRC